MMTAEDVNTVGISLEAHRLLEQMKNDGVFKEMADGYRLGVALAISRGQVGTEEVKGRRTFLSHASLDPQGLMRDMISELFPEARDRPYAFLQRLAEYGVMEMGRLHEARRLRFGGLFAPREGKSVG
jgi:hypothetical protein